jgi:hypothetical protein
MARFYLFVLHVLGQLLVPGALNWFGRGLATRGWSNSHWRIAYKCAEPGCAWYSKALRVESTVIKPCHPGAGEVKIYVIVAVCQICHKKLVYDGDSPPESVEHLGSTHFPPPLPIRPW